MEKRPLIAITMGDPSGIGPEIIRKISSDDGIHEVCRPFVIGDPDVFSFYVNNDFSISVKTDISEIRTDPGHMDIMAVSHINDDKIVPGRPSLKGGILMVESIIKAVNMARNKQIAAMVTCPINKALMNRAGYKFEGHTQLISHLTGTDDYVMMLAGEKLRVTLVTIHCSLKEVPSRLNQDNIFKTISITANSLMGDFAIKYPRIAVAALNPHAGEEGLFGSEEKDIILPAIKKALDAGYNVEGPLPADTLYPKAISGNFDAVVNMYHDQGLIPLKLLHFSDAVNVTLGLPIIRTSVDHGTAYDIAGKGVADPNSLKAAIIMAAKMAKNRFGMRD
jgi:4-hydroxythreonine-4-phosphate dehydrogenase